MSAEEKVVLGIFTAAVAVLAYDAWLYWRYGGEQ